ncbi:MAG: hypothetical protein R2749_02165 [Acidimicrobiales bacterium]
MAHRPGGGAGPHLAELVVGPFAARRLPTAELVRTDEYGERKRRAFTCYRTQTTNPTGEAGWATFEPDWIEPYLEAEVSFPVDAGAVARFRLDRRQQVLGEVTPVAGLAPALAPTGGPGRTADGLRSAGSPSAAPTYSPVSMGWRGCRRPGCRTVSPAPCSDRTCRSVWRRPSSRRPPATSPMAAAACCSARTAPAAGGGSPWAPTTPSWRDAPATEPWTVVATDRDGATAVEVVTVSVYDDGRRLDCRRDGATLFGGPVTDDATPTTTPPDR